MTLRAIFIVSNPWDASADYKLTCDVYTDSLVTLFIPYAIQLIYGKYPLNVSTVYNNEKNVMMIEREPTINFIIVTHWFCNIQRKINFLWLVLYCSFNTLSCSPLKNHTKFSREMWFSKPTTLFNFHLNLTLSSHFFLDRNNGYEIDI